MRLVRVPSQVLDCSDYDKHTWKLSKVRFIFCNFCQVSYNGISCSCMSCALVFISLNAIDLAYFLDNSMCRMDFSTVYTCVIDIHYSVYINERGPNRIKTRQIVQNPILNYLLRELANGPEDWYRLQNHILQDLVAPILYCR